MTDPPTCSKVKYEEQVHTVASGKKFLFIDKQKHSGHIECISSVAASFLASARSRCINEFHWLTFTRSTYSLIWAFSKIILIMKKYITLNKKQ